MGDLKQELLDRNGGDAKLAAAELCQGLMRSNPAEHKLGYTLPNAILAAVKMYRGEDEHGGGNAVTWVAEVAAEVGRRQAADDTSHTPNGYDPRWVEAINGVLTDRETGVRITDLNDEIWERWIGPMIDAAGSEPVGGGDEWTEVMEDHDASSIEADPMGAQRRGE